MRWKTSRLTGWGRTQTAESEVARPERGGDGLGLLTEPGEKSVIAFGGGRSYGDAALNDKGRVILTERLNRITEFDADSGEVVAEPGVTFKELLDVFLPKGYLPPASPGTAFVTVGGAVANDVHGRNHDAVGSFGHHVQWIELLLPNGESVLVSPKDNRPLFEATIGGIGLTGLITAVCFKLARVPSSFVLHKERRIADLDRFIEAFSELTADEMVYSAGWIDGLARGKDLGRGILEVARPIQGSLESLPKSCWTVPFDFPPLALNNWVVKGFNELYYRRIPDGGRERETPYNIFLYPLDSILKWNRVYGKRGFRQFQCVLPYERSERGLRLLLEKVAQSHPKPFLGVLKTLGGPGLGHLSFPLKGFTLALDFPNNAGAVALLKVLEGIVRDHGGRVYLAKDSCLSAEGFAEMYPRAKDFRSILEDIDPDGIMASDMSRRLGIRS